MAPIVVEPDTLAGAGDSISAVGDELATTLSTLAAALPNGAMAGNDRAGLAFGQAYRQAGQALLNAGAVAVTGGRKVGFGVQMSATNYSRADASSTIGGGASALAPPMAPVEFTAPTVPSPFGGGVAEPFLWSMVEMFVGDVWPNGDPGQLRAAASAWSSFASTLSGIGAQLSGPSAIVSGQQMPEGSAMTKALSDLKQGLSDITTESVKLATQTFEFAADVEAAQNAIRDLLSRLSPSGIFGGLQAIFSGDALEEVKEIADDIRTVLDNLKRQANARQQSMQDVMQLIDRAVVSLEQYARKEFTHFLGDDVGNAVATVFDTSLNMREGLIKGGFGAIEDLQQLNPLRFAYDFEGAKDTWGGMLETNFNASVVGSILNPERAAETQKEMLKGLVHAEDWTTDRPGLGLGENIFDVGSAFVGGAGAARTGTRAAGEAADAADAAAQGVRAAGALDNAVTDTSAIAGRAGSISDKLDDLGDNIPTGAAPNATGPAVPRDLVEPPSAPRIPEAPVSRAPEAPTPVDRSPSAPNSSTQTSTPPHTAAGAGEAPRTGTPPAGEMPESSVPAAVETRSAPLEGTRAPFESRPIAGDGRPVWSNHENASPDNGTHNAGGDSSSTNDYDAGQSHDSLAPDGRMKFSGHGSYDPANGEVAVPSGTSVTFYAEHGAKITDALGNLIETGGDASRVYSRTFYPGEIVPNYTLHPPEGLIVHGSPYTVEASTQLSSILRDNMGDIDFAACLYDPTAPLNRVFDVDGIYDETDGTFTHIYEKAEDQNGFDDEHFEYEQSADNDHTQPYYGFGQDEYTDSENWDYDDIDFDEF